MYRNILAAIDLHPACDQIILARAHQLTGGGTLSANLSIVHAVEHINVYGVAQVYSAVIDLEAEIRSEARKQLAELATKYAIPETRQFVEVGSPKIVILNKIKQLKADLVIIGSHGRHGIGILFGSMASSVIHYLSCDALVVKKPHDKNNLI